MLNREEEFCMSTNTIGRQTWTLTVIRSTPGEGEVPEEEEFDWGRNTYELLDDDRPPKFLPSGLVHLLDRYGIISEAMETGFVVEMSSRAQPLREWVCFERMAIGNRDSRPGPKVGHYAVSGGTESFEMIEVFHAEELPKKVWIRAVELDLQRLGWLIDSGLMKRGEKVQATLDEWCVIENVGWGADVQAHERERIVLPGPPGIEMGFF